jgi:hypothetical protein
LNFLFSIFFFNDLGTFFFMRVEEREMDGWIKWVDDDLMAVIVQLWVNEFSREL